MTVVRAHVEWMIDPIFPANNMVNVPHFDVHAVIPGDDPAWVTLAGDLATASQAWQSQQAVGKKVKVKVYDAEAAPPNYPKAEYVTETGQEDMANWPRELAVCLSFFAGRNIPRHRGRLYICPGLMFNSNGLDTYVTSAIQEKVLSYRTVLENLGGVNVDWVVWSRADRKAYPVTDVWVDDEWDVQRRRGVEPKGRVTAQTDEARVARSRSEIEELREAGRESLAKLVGEAAAA